MRRFYGPIIPAAWLLSCLVAVAAWQPARAEDQVTFRDLVRKYAEDGDGKVLAKQIGFSESVKHVVALEYTILLRTGAGEKAVDPKVCKFKLGDEIRVRIEPVNDAYIYIFTEGASGKRECLLPKTDRGEEAPFVKGGAKVQLPDDGGTIQFVAPAGAEQLLVVAAEKPTADLAGLANVVFDKPEDQLTPAEKAIRQTLQAKVKAKLQSIRKRQSESISYRGLLTKEALDKVAGQVAKSGKSRSVLEEPPAGGQDGTFAMVASTRQDDQPSLMVHIALTSVDKEPQKP